MKSYSKYLHSIGKCKPDKQTVLLALQITLSHVALSELVSLLYFDSAFKRYLEVGRFLSFLNLWPPAFFMDGRPSNFKGVPQDTNRLHSEVWLPWASVAGL